MQATTAKLLEQPVLLQQESQTLLKRFSQQLKPLAKQRWPELYTRLSTQLPALLRLYLSLYAERYDCYYHLEQLLKSLAKSLASRPDYLCQLDQQPQDWHKQNNQWGLLCRFVCWRFRRPETANSLFKANRH